MDQCRNIFKRTIFVQALVLFVFILSCGLISCSKEKADQVQAQKDMWVPPKPEITDDSGATIESVDLVLRELKTSDFFTIGWKAPPKPATETPLPDKPATDNPAIDKSTTGNSDSSVQAKQNQSQKPLPATEVDSTKSSHADPVSSSPEFDAELKSYTFTTTCGDEFERVFTKVVNGHRQARVRIRELVPEELLFRSPRKANSQIVCHFQVVLTNQNGSTRRYQYPQLTIHPDRNDADLKLVNQMRGTSFDGSTSIIRDFSELPYVAILQAPFVSGNAFLSCDEIDVSMEVVNFQVMRLSDLSALIPRATHKANGGPIKNPLQYCRLIVSEKKPASATLASSGNDSQTSQSLTPSNRNTTKKLGDQPSQKNAQDSAVERDNAQSGKLDPQIPRTFVSSYFLLKISPVDLEMSEQLITDGYQTLGQQNVPFFRIQVRNVANVPVAFSVPKLFKEAFHYNVTYFLTLLRGVRFYGEYFDSYRHNIKESRPIVASELRINVPREYIRDETTNLYLVVVPPQRTIPILGFVDLAAPCAMRFDVRETYHQYIGSRFELRNIENFRIEQALFSDTATLKNLNPISSRRLLLNYQATSQRDYLYKFWSPYGLISTGPADMFVTSTFLDKLQKFSNSYVPHDEPSKNSDCRNLFSPGG